jgi:hypothetical protein
MVRREASVPSSAKSRRSELAGDEVCQGQAGPCEKTGGKRGQDVVIFFTDVCLVVIVSIDTDFVRIARHSACVLALF